jgi:hypothetical protein
MEGQGWYAQGMYDPGVPSSSGEWEEQVPALRG